MSTAHKTLSGTVTKHVDCESCGRGYEYEMSRTVFGKCAIDAASRAEAEAEAVRDAEAKLKIKLAEGCDVVACPSCGGLTAQMKAHRRGFFGAAFALMGVGAAALVYVLVMMLWIHKIYIFAAVAGAGCLLLGLIGLLMACFSVLMPKKAKQ